MSPTVGEGERLFVRRTNPDTVGDARTGSIVIAETEAGIVIGRLCRRSFGLFVTFDGDPSKKEFPVGKVIAKAVCAVRRFA